MTENEALTGLFRPKLTLQFSDNESSCSSELRTPPTPSSPVSPLMDGCFPSLHNDSNSAKGSILDLLESAGRKIIADLELNSSSSYRPIYEISFGEGKVGLALETDLQFDSTMPRTVVKETSGAAAESGKILRGDILLSVNDIDVSSMEFCEVMSHLRNATRPMLLRFRPFYQSNYSSNSCGELQSFLASRSTAQESSASASATANDFDSLNGEPNESVDGSENPTEMSESNEDEGNVLDEPSRVEKIKRFVRESSSPSILSPIRTHSFSNAPFARRSSFNEFDKVKLLAISAETTAPVVTNCRDVEGSNKAKVIVSWRECSGAKIFQVQYSRDWPMKVWKTAPEKEIKQCSESRLNLSMEVDGLDYEKSYVFRIRCGLSANQWAASGPASCSVQMNEQRFPPPDTQRGPVFSPRAAYDRLSSPRPTTLSSSLLAISDVPVVQLNDQNSTTAINLQWTACPAALCYQIQCGKKAFGKVTMWSVVKEMLYHTKLSSIIAPNGRSMKEYIVKNLKPNTEYVFRVRAGDSFNPANVSDMDETNWGEFSPASAVLCTMESPEQQEQREKRREKRKVQINKAKKMVSKTTTSLQRANQRFKESIFSRKKTYSVSIPASVLVNDVELDAMRISNCSDIQELRDRVCCEDEIISINGTSVDVNGLAEVLENLTDCTELVVVQLMRLTAGSRGPMGSPSSSSPARHPPNGLQTPSSSPPRSPVQSKQRPPSPLRKSRGQVSAQTANNGCEHGKESKQMQSECREEDGAEVFVSL